MTMLAIAVNVCNFCISAVVLYPFCKETIVLSVVPFVSFWGFFAVRLGVAYTVASKGVSKPIAQSALMREPISFNIPDRTHGYNEKLE